MSSSESGDESRDSTESQPKYNRPRTRISRACDTCRRRKVKCDVGSVPGRKCTNCVVYNRACTFKMTVKKRGLPKGYVEHLENVLHSMESLLKNLYPDTDFSEELGTIEPWTRTSKRQAKTAATASSSSTNVSKVKSTDPFPREEEALLSDDDDTVCIQTLEDRLERIKIHPVYSRYIGKASAPFLIQKVYEAKQEYRAEIGLEVDRSKERPRSGTRPEFLQLHPWIAPLMHNPSPHQDFPPTDLREKLVELYFRNFNDYYPLFHRPTFERRISDGLHLSDEGFGSTVLLVCALGSKFSDDPRVLVDGEDRCPQSRGWRYFRQVQSVQKSLLAPPQLHDLQICALSALFLRCSNIPRWTVIGAGIRMAQDVGAHRQKSYGKVHTVEIEHWRRAFWVLVAIDREMSMGLGRPYATQDEDYDLDMPAECDDEYWVISDNEVKFKQPSGRPSKITYFNRLVQLNQILATALRTIYSINKAKVLSGLAGRPWEEDIISKLDSALNEWLDTLPEHLRWNPDRADRRKEIFLNQSAQLYTLYYQAQIIVHRTFIPALRKTSSPSFPSLVICANAARSTARILSVPFRRYNSVSMFSINAMVCAAVALLLNIWGSRRSGAPPSSHEDMVYVELLLDMLKHLETQWFNAGRIWDILYGLAYGSDLQTSPDEDTSSQEGLYRQNDAGYSDSRFTTSHSRSYITGWVGMDDALPVAGPSAGGSSFGSGYNDATAVYSTGDMSGSSRSYLANDGGSLSCSSIYNVDCGRTPVHTNFNDSWHPVNDNHCDWAPVVGWSAESSAKTTPLSSMLPSTEYPHAPSTSRQSHEDPTWDQMMTEIAPWLGSPYAVLEAADPPSVGDLMDLFKRDTVRPSASTYNYTPDNNPSSSTSGYVPEPCHPNGGNWHLNV